MLFQSIFHILMLFPFLTYADEVVIKPPYGEVFSIEVNPEERFSDVMQLIGGYLNEGETEERSATNQEEVPENLYVLDFSQNYLAAVNYHQVAVSSGSPASGTRDYFAQPTAAQKEDIAFIIRTLSSGSFLTLLGKRADLQAAGKRIEAVHPLKLIHYILSDSELKAGIKVMSTKSMVWKEFRGNIADNLDKEARNKTMTKEALQHFAKGIKINQSAIVPPWGDFLDFAVSQ